MRMILEFAGFRHECRESRQTGGQAGCSRDRRTLDSLRLQRIEDLFLLNRASERGSGRTGFFITMVVVVAVIFVGIKVIPVRITAYNFRDKLRQEARWGAVRKSDASVAKRILDHAIDLEIPLDEKKLNVKRTKSKIIITVEYEQAIDLAVTTYTYKFRAKEQAPLF